MVTITEEKKARKINIDWGRQGGAVIGYIVIILGYFGVIANTMMYNDFGNWISFVDMDRTILFWTYQTYISAILDPVVSILIIVVLTALLIVFSIIDWHSYIIVLILIPIYILFVLDLFMNLFDIITVLDTGTFYFTIPGLSLVLLFLICFVLTYKEDIPQYGIKASLWMVPLLIALAFFFYTFMFGISAESFILQFGSGEGYVNILILSLTVIAGSLSGMRIKKETLIRKEQFELAR